MSETPDATVTGICRGRIGHIGGYAAALRYGLVY